MQSKALVVGDIEGLMVGEVMLRWLYAVEVAESSTPTLCQGQDATRSICEANGEQLPRFARTCFSVNLRANAIDVVVVSCLSV